MSPTAPTTASRSGAPSRGEDGSVVACNRIERIRADGGGTGQNGNGINAFRAGGVLVCGNRVSDCAYSAVRGNSSSDIQIIANSCTRLGEVALYAEFAFQGALIANNLVDTAAIGIQTDGARPCRRTVRRQAPHALRQPRRLAITP
jgi:uncharacterized secreted repeat protein (TIGR03808 family)